VEEAHEGFHWIVSDVEMASLPCELHQLFQMLAELISVDVHPYHMLSASRQTAGPALQYTCLRCAVPQRVSKQPQDATWSEGAAMVKKAGMRSMQDVLPQTRCRFKLMKSDLERDQH